MGHYLDGFKEAASYSIIGAVLAAIPALIIGYAIKKIHTENIPAEYFRFKESKLSSLTN